MVRGERFNRSMRDSFIRQKVVDVWNELPEEVVEAGIITAFRTFGQVRG